MRLETSAPLSTSLFPLERLVTMALSQTLSSELSSASRLEKLSAGAQLDLENSLEASLTLLASLSTL